MYPFGLILGGTLIAAYEKDEGTIAVGDARRKKDGFGTLQEDSMETFKKVAGQVTPDNYAWNESIVHKPMIKAILIDETMLGVEMLKGDEVKEYFSQDQEEAIRAKYGDSIVSAASGTPTKGPHAGKPVFMINRVRSGLDKALEYAHDNYGEFPVYIRRNDGIYNLTGRKVGAAEIYK